LFEQMLGRGTRICPDIVPPKSHFVVFDCFDGTLIEAFKKASGMVVDVPTSEPIPIAEVIERIWNNDRREYHVKVLAGRLRRIEKEISGQGREQWLELCPKFPIEELAQNLEAILKTNFTEVMQIFRSEA